MPIDREIERYREGDMPSASELNRLASTAELGVNVSGPGLSATAAGLNTQFEDDRFLIIKITSSNASTITGATNASPIVITTSGSHGLTTGASVTLSGVMGNTAANGTFTITVISPTSYSLGGSTGNGSYTSGGTGYPVPTAYAWSEITENAEGVVSVKAGGLSGTTTYLPAFELNNAVVAANTIQRAEMGEGGLFLVFTAAAGGPLTVRDSTPTVTVTAVATLTFTATDFTVAAGASGEAVVSLLGTVRAQTIRVTSTSTTNGRYPGKLQTVTAVTGGPDTFVDGADVWAIGVNNEPLYVGYYEADYVGNKNGRDIYKAKWTAASATAAGIVTTGTQTLAGEKTMADHLHMENAKNFYLLSGTIYLTSTLVSFLSPSSLQWSNNSNAAVSLVPAQLDASGAGVILKSTYTLNSDLTQYAYLALQHFSGGAFLIIGQINLDTQIQVYSGGAAFTGKTGVLGGMTFTHGLLTTLPTALTVSGGTFP